jgi:hypothetical protein
MPRGRTGKRISKFPQPDLSLEIERPRGRGGIGRRIGLKPNLSARRETGDAELLKFGEPCQMAIPSQARTEHSGREGVETRRAAPAALRLW